jgi:O-antigen/teichoic acid export membrane protein
MWENKSLFKESSHTLVCQVLGFLFGIGTSIVLNRILGPAGKGRFTALLIVPQLVVAFTHFGYGIASSYFIGKKKYTEGDVFRSDLLLNLFIGIIGAGVGYLIYYYLFPEENLYVRLGLLFLVFSGLWFYYFPDILLGKGKILLQNYWNLAYQVLRFILISAFLLFFANKLMGALSASIVLGVFLYISSFILLSRIINFQGTFNPSYIRDGFKLGRKVFLTEILGFLNYRFDIIFLKIYSTSSQIGFYSTAVFIAETLWMIPRAVSLVLYTRLVRGEVKEHVTSRILKITVMLVLILAIVSVFIVKPTIRLFYTDAFIPAYLPFLILLPGVIFLTIPKVLASHFVGVWGKPGLLLRGRSVAVPINIILNLILIPKYGMHGAAIASSLAYIIEAVFFILVFNKEKKNVVLFKR